MVAPLRARKIEHLALRAHIGARRYFRLDESGQRRGARELARETDALHGVVTVGRGRQIVGKNARPCHRIG